MDKGTIVWRPEGLPGVELQRGVSTSGDVPRHWHEEHRLFAVTGGYGELWVGGATYPTPPGSLALVVAGDVHAYRTPRDGGCDFLALDFDPALDEGVTLSSAILDAEMFRSFVAAHRRISAGEPSAWREFLALL